MKWVIFIYKVPSQPTKYRAYLWREIKKLGALYLQDGVCIAPDTDDVQLFIGSLGEKVQQWGGQEYSFVATMSSNEKDQDIVKQFNAARDEEYRELLPLIQRFQEHFEEKEDWEFSDEQALRVRDEFQKLLRHFQVIEARDYFETDTGRKLRSMLEQCRQQIYKRF